MSAIEEAWRKLEGEATIDAVPASIHFLHSIAAKGHADQVEEQTALIVVRQIDCVQHPALIGVESVLLTYAREGAGHE